MKKKNSIKKKIILRSLLGAPLGISICFLVTVMISLAAGDGNYYPVVPELAVDCGSEMNAVLLQTMLSLLYGAVWGGASVIWEIESWSLLRMTITHLAVCCSITLPVSWYLRWMPHSAAGILIYFGIFMGIYLFIWFSQYSTMKKQVKQLNHRVQKEN